MTTQIQEVSSLHKTDPQAAKVLDTKVQAPVLAAQAAVVEEAEGNKTLLMQRLVTAAKKFAESEDSLSKGLAADMVLAIVPLLTLPNQIRPKYAAIAEQITRAMGRGDVAARTQVRLPDETLNDRFGKPAYKQQATRWVNMARWETGLFNKAEVKHQKRNPGWSMTVTYGGKTYTSPVSMLRAGVAYTTVHQTFKNVVSPLFTDFFEMDERATEKVARNAAKKLAVKLRVVNDAGDVVRGKHIIAGSAPLTHGTILELLSALKVPLSQKRYDEVQAALLLAAPAPTKA